MAEVISKDFSINMEHQNNNPQVDSSVLQSHKNTDPKHTDPSFPISTNSQTPDSLLERKSQCSPAKSQKFEKKGTRWRGRIFMFLIFVESTVFVCALGLLITSLTVDKLNDSVLWDLGIWKWCLLVLAIVCGRLIAYLIAEGVLFLIWMFWLDEKVLYFAYGVKKSVMFVIWVSLVTLAWGLLSSVGVKRSKDTTKILHDVTKGLGGCLIGAALWLLKTLFVKLVGSLHATKLFDKIKDAIRLRKALRALSVANKEMQNRYSVGVGLFRCFSIADIDDIDSDKQKVNKIALFQQKVHQLLYKMGLKKTEEKVEMVTMIELINAIRGKRLLPLTYITTTNNKDGMLPGKNSYSGSSQEITDEAEAKAAANDIFSTLAGSENEGYLDLKKLLEFVKDEKVMEQFQGLAEDKKSNAQGHEQINTEQKQNSTEEKHIKKSVFRNWVVEIFWDHDSLSNTLKYSKTAIDELNVIASVIVLLVIIFMWLIIMEFIPTKLLLFLSSQILLVVFMFGNTAKTVFEAVIFVFVVHPFDIGDRCVVQGVQMIVDEMNILTTTFLRYDGEKIYYPNSVLATKPISNFYRSPPMMDSVEFAINLRTPTNILEQLQEKIKTYLENNPKRWRHDHSVLFREIEDMNKMKVVLYCNHTINFQNIGKMGKRRSKLVLEMKRIFQELKIEYHLLPQQVNLISSYVGSTNSQQVPLPETNPFPELII